MIDEQTTESTRKTVDVFSSAPETTKSPIETGETQLTAGQLLRAGRIKAGFELSQIAQSLKVPVTRIVALENDSPISPNDITFMRVLANSLCHKFQINAQEVLLFLPKKNTQSSNTTTDLIDSPKLVVNLKDNSYAAIKNQKNDGMGFLHHFTHPAVVWVSLFLVGTLAVLFTPKIDFSGFSGLNAIPKTTAGVGVNESKIMPVPIIALQATPVLQTENSTTDTPIITVMPKTLPPTPIANTPVATDARTDAFFNIKASAETWVSVRDDHGKSMVNKAIKAGEFLEIPKTAGVISVTIGRADAVEVHVHGKPFDVMSISATHGNVARFEVSPNVEIAQTTLQAN